MNGMDSMKRFLTPLLMGWVLATPIYAQSDRVVVVELFTSQGCSSCPPADALLGKLASDKRVIPLALHVDYWDYLGWKDKFAKAEHSERQRAYARAGLENMVYTPQMIISGDDRIVGSKAAEIEAAIRRHAAKASPVFLAVTRNGNRILIEAKAVQAPSGILLVQLVRYRPSQEVTIKRGENAGKTVTYHNIVTSLQQIAKWNPNAPLSMEAKADGADPVVVIVQSEGPAEIVAAAALR
jgi:hypothetical protein